MLEKRAARVSDVGGVEVEEGLHGGRESATAFVIPNEIGGRGHADDGLDMEVVSRECAGQSDEVPTSRITEQGDMVGL